MNLCQFKLADLSPTYLDNTVTDEVLEESPITITYSFTCPEPHLYIDSHFMYLEQLFNSHLFLKID